MRRILLLTLLVPFFAAARQAGFDIAGTVTGFTDGTEVKLANGNDNADVATAKVAGGRFLLKGTVSEPTLCKLMIGTEPFQYVYVDNNKMTLTARKGDVQHLKISGSPVEADFQKFQQVFDPLIGSLNKTVNALNQATQRPAYDALMKEYDSIRGLIQRRIDEFVAARPKSVVSAFMLLVTAEMYDDPMLLEQRFNKLDPSVKNFTVSKNLASYIQYNKVGAVGTMAVDFTQPDTAGAPVALSSFRGKYVLVDFWASWCGPCRAENPNVLQNYQQFKAKDFTILGVSLDRPGGRENWLGAIRKDGLAWTQVSDLQFWNNAAAQLYRVQSIPYNMLIDPTGKIIAKNLRGEQLHSKLCEVLGCN